MNDLRHILRGYLTLHRLVRLARSFLHCDVPYTSKRSWWDLECWRQVNILVSICELLLHKLLLIHLSILIWNSWGDLMIVKTLAFCANSPFIIRFISEIRVVSLVGYVLSSEFESGILNELFVSHSLLIDETFTGVSLRRRLLSVVHFHYSNIISLFFKIN